MLKAVVKAQKSRWKPLCVFVAPFFDQMGAYLEGNGQQSELLLLAVFAIFAALKKIRKS